MKCISCGGEVSLTDKVCPHCGRPLTETAGYRRDLSHYGKDSAKTKKKAREILSENVPIVISAFLMLLLLAAVCGVLYVKENAYRFRDDAARRESVKKYETYRAEISRFLEAGDYTGFAAFMDVHNIAEWEEPYADLNLLVDLAGDYSRLASAVEEATMFGPEARRYDPESDISSVHSAIWNFYFELDSQREKIEEDPCREYIHDMKEKADLILEIYLGLDEAGREEYFAASDIRQEAYLEEVLPHE
ncbi:MAG: zinc ribbon domain-containing protein [Lachnospiraceae bacterium]|nr:zinc ribbon domain-containing protein [Lachnospiraceae bacterium]